MSFDVGQVLNPEVTLTAPLVHAACRFRGGPGGGGVVAAYLSRYGLGAAIVRNGVGDYTLTLNVDPGNEHFISDSCEAGSMTVTLVGTALRVVTTDLAGAPLDATFSVAVFAVPQH